MTSSHFSARPMPLLLWTSIAKATFLSLSFSLLDFFSFSSILYALSLGLLGGLWFSHFDFPRLHGTREQPKWQILSGKIESKINFKVQRSRAHGRIILVYRSFLLDDQSPIHIATCYLLPSICHLLFVFKIRVRDSQKEWN